ncbi:toll/interleukin-1 receptor domain-containing protein [Streptomyces sp. NBC_01635]|uniref:toll/interleukin-1 receptor domain-containing protein n=1 Tax=Streptomyces sp. NBC_01635 TaxID=2975904 RepID=UPI00386B85FD|nr:toll/interleukin-1 receptor domain-containing protein [Streptomyces sp. NBC_01635]
MGGIFINYRRSEQHRGTVRAVRDRLAEHFGADQVFLDVESISPGRRYPDELRKRLADAEVLLAVIHEGWAAERDEDGVRRLFREDDWVRMEIETALRTGKAVIPVVLAGAEPPSADELPENLSEFALKNAHFLSSLASDMWVPGREALVALLERDHVAPLWEIYQPSKPDRSTVSGCWLTVRTILAAVVVTGLAWAVAGDPRSEPWLAPVSIGAMSFGLLLVFTLCVPLRGVFNRFEHWLHGVSERTYLLLTSGPLIVLFLLGLAIAVRLWTGEVEPGAVLFAVVFAFVLFWMAMRIVQADAREREQWNRWPTKLPRRVPRRLLRRTVARLEERVAAWTSRLTREQRGKASVELEEIEHALYRLRGETERSRLRWLTEDMPGPFSVYAVWIAANTVLALAWPAGAVTVLGLAATLTSPLVALATVETLYRHQRWLRRVVYAEIEPRRAALAATVEELSSPARTKPTQPSTGRAH